VVLRRPLWLWGAAALVCLAGILVGPTVYAVGATVWAAFQPQSFVSGWEVVALLALVGVLWVGAACIVTSRLRGKAGVAFAIAAVATASASAIYERFQPPSEVIQGTMTGEAAAVWRDYRP